MTKMTQSAYLRINTGNPAIFAAIRRALAGCTPGAASIKFGVCAECGRHAEAD
jgi:hypothetical protein